MDLIIKAIVGLLAAKYGSALASFVMKMFKLYFFPILGMKLNLRKYGSWAVVTGATDGIGKAVAKELAKRGLNLVLISRSKDKLDAVSEEIKKSNDVEVKTISYDFSNPNDYESLSSVIQPLDIGLLVNNVGISYDHPDFYLHYDEKYFDDMVNINITSVLKMTRIVLKQMVERKKGLLVHLSSSSSLQIVPFLSVYSASKVFVNNFSESLHHEYSKSGIKSQVVYPYFVATKLSKLRPNGLMVPSAEQYAQQMVNAIGLSKSMSGFWFHEIFLAITSILPKWFVVMQTKKMMDATRRRWERKQAKKD